MKRVLFLFALCFSLSSVVSANTFNPDIKPNYIIIDDIIGCLTNHQLTAISVEVKVLDRFGNVLGMAQTVPGQTVTFSCTGHEREIVYIYNMGSGQDYIIFEAILDACH